MSFAWSTLPVSLDTSATMVGGSAGFAGCAKTMPPYDVPVFASTTCQPGGIGRSMVGDPGSPWWMGVSVILFSVM